MPSPMKIRLDDYIDGDVSYLLGLIVARGTIVDSATQRQLSIEFSSTSLKARGIKSAFDPSVYIKLGLADIRERLISSAPA
jgi:hypothetical protein